MAKAYWISSYRKILDPNKLAAYAKLAGPAIEAGGGRFLARSTAAAAYEDGVAERTVLIEFDSVEKALATHDSPAYKAALAALDGGVVRDMRIVPGVCRSAGTFAERLVSFSRPLVYMEHIYTKVYQAATLSPPDSPF